MTPVWILVGCVAVIGGLLILYKRGVFGSPKVQDTPAGTARQ